MFSKQFFNQAQKEAIQSAIAEAELNTSGEIRVHIDDKCPVAPVEKAIEVFEKLKMHETELRNGVLIYVAVKDHKLAIVGDQGINDAVADNFWDEIKNNLIESFKKGLYAEGLSDCIKSAGMQLKAHFPYQSDDINELSDEISFGEGKDEMK